MELVHWHEDFRPALLFFFFIVYDLELNQDYYFGDGDMLVIFHSQKFAVMAS